MSTLPYPTLLTLPYHAYPLSPSSALMKHFMLSILYKGSCPALGCPTSGALPFPTITAQTVSQSRPFLGSTRAEDLHPQPNALPPAQPLASPQHSRRTALQVGVSHSRHYVGNGLHIHIVIVQGLWRCLRARLHQEETEPAAQVFRAVCLLERKGVEVHAQLLTPRPHSCLPTQSPAVEKCFLT